MGLADAAMGMNASIQQQLEKRLQAQAVARQIAQQQFQNQMAEKQFASGEEIKRANLASLEESRQASAADRKFKQGQDVNEAVPGGTKFAETDPLVPVMRGSGGLLTMDPQTVGAPPEMLARAGDSGAPQELPGTMPLSPMPTTGLRTLTKAPSQKQQATAIDDQRARDTVNREIARDAQNAKNQTTMAGIAQQNANNSGQSRDLTDQIKALQIQAAQDKLDKGRTDAAHTADSAKQSTDLALSAVDRLLGDPSKKIPEHPGLSKASGIISSRTSFMSQDAADFDGLRDQLVATLTLPNLGALKGPMSDKDIVFVKQLATRLGNKQLSDTETRKALQEARTFLRQKAAMGNETPGVAKGGAAGPADPLGIR